MSESFESVSTQASSEALETLFLKHLGTIQKIVNHVGHRYRLSQQDREDFESIVNLKLISDNYKILRDFEGRCKLESFIFLIVNRIYWEWRHQTEGRWRPSVHAERLGKLAVKLETLVYRDGYLFSEASKILAIHHGLSVRQCEEIIEKLPVRSRREMVSGWAFDDVAAADGDHEAKLLDDELRTLGQQIQQAINQALRNFSEEDQMILNLHFHDDLKMVDIARSLNIPPKRLYKRVKKLLNQLRKELKRKGFGKIDQEELFKAVKITALSNDATPQPGTEGF